MRLDDIWVVGGKYLPFLLVAMVLAVMTVRPRSKAVTWEDKSSWIEHVTIRHTGKLFQVLVLGLVFWWAIYKLAIGAVNPFLYFSF